MKCFGCCAKVTLEEIEYSDFLVEDLDYESVGWALDYKTGMWDEEKHVFKENKPSSLDKEFRHADPNENWADLPNMCKNCVQIVVKSVEEHRYEGHWRYGE